MPLLSGVTHLGFKFWLPTTTTWDEDVKPLSSNPKNRPAGPALQWDSTRAVLTEKDVRSGQFAFRANPESLADPSDDLFPSRIEVTVVIRGSAEFPSLDLAREVGAKDTMIWLSSVAGLPHEGYIRVGDEWMRYESIQGDALKLKKSGRGARGTKAAKHLIGTEVDVGTTFRRVVEIPAHRAPARRYSLLESGKVRRRGG